MTRVSFWILLLSLVSIPAHAFIWINSGTTYNSGATPVSSAPAWSGRTVTYYVNTNLRVMGGSMVPEVTSTEFVTAVSQAIDAWNSVCGSDVRVVLAGSTSNVKATNDSMNVIMWDDRTTAEGSYRGSPTPLAFAVPVVSNGVVSDCEVIVNGENTDTISVDGSASGYDLKTIMIHEIGHCLGLDHTASPPTYTSSNSILLNSVMFAGLAAGDLTKRTLSQDEVDAMECLYPSTAGYSLRGGYYCTSYHGTNGGAAISGTVSGGPASARTCGEGITATVTKSSSSGGGCVTNAIAADENAPREPLSIGWTFLFPLLALFFLRKKIARFFLSFLLFASLEIPALAAVEVAYTITRATPAAVKTASEFSTAEGTFTSTTATPDNYFATFGDLYAAISYFDSPQSRWGLYGKKSITKKLALVGKDSSGTTLVSKDSSLDAWLVGVSRIYQIFPTGAGLNAFLELQLGAGSATYSQKITDYTTATNSIEGSAFLLETNAYLGLQYPFWGMLNGLIKVGYGRLHSNYFAVKSVSGGRYGTLKAGDRLAVRGQDMRLERDGFSIQLGLALISGGYSGSASSE